MFRLTVHHVVVIGQRKEIQAAVLGTRDHRCNRAVAVAVLRLTVQISRVSGARDRIEDLACLRSIGIFDRVDRTARDHK